MPTDEPSESTVYEEMEPLEPYTASELAGRVDAERGIVRRLLDSLSQDDRVRKKQADAGPAVWVREAPRYECPDCGDEYQIRFVHPVFSSARFCPRCGTRLP